MKGYNNLFDSIISLIVILAGICANAILIYFGWIKNDNPLDPGVMFGFITETIIFLLVVIPCIYTLFDKCFEIWEIREGVVTSKKLLRKRISIKKEEIICIIEKEIPAFIFGKLKTNALIIESSDKTICIYLNDKVSADNIKRELNKNDCN